MGIAVTVGPQSNVRRIVVSDDYSQNLTQTRKINSKTAERYNEIFFRADEVALRLEILEAILGHNIWEQVLNHINWQLSVPWW